MGRDSFLGTLLVATVLCVVCSLLVSLTAVGLHSTQEANKKLYKRTNILLAAGLLRPKGIEATGEEASVPEAGTLTPEQVEELFKGRVHTVLVNLDEGTIVPDSEVPYDTYDPRTAASDPQTSEPITVEGPTPGIDHRAKMAFAYEVMAEGDDSKIEEYVLPVYGKGLWSTIYGFISIDADGQTVDGITFYEHGETPGLGGEVENPSWQARWKGILARDNAGDVLIKVVKAGTPIDEAAAKSEIDGLSGATMTTRGVSNFVEYWLGPGGFGPFLDKQTGK